MNTKLTKKQIKEIKQLKKKEWKYDDLAKKFKVNRSTIGYHMRGAIQRPHKTDGIGDHPEEIPLFIRQNIEKQKRAEPEERIKRNICVICGKEKEWKWRKTNFCGIKCFNLL